MDLNQNAVLCVMHLVNVCFFAGMLQLKELADAIAEKLQDWVYVGAELHGKKDDGEHPCKILKVLEEGVDGHRYEVAWLDKNKSTIDKAEVTVSFFCLLRTRSCAGSVLAGWRCEHPMTTGLLLVCICDIGYLARTTNSKLCSEWSPLFSFDLVKSMWLFFSCFDCIRVLSPHTSVAGPGKKKRRGGHSRSPSSYSKPNPEPPPRLSLVF